MSDDRLWEDAGSVFRPSYSATWLNCAGSLLPSRYATDTAGEDAAIGTVFHKVMAEWQLFGRPDHWLGLVERVEAEQKTDFFDVLIDEDMFTYGEDCLAYVKDIPGDRFIETRVDISDLTPIPKQGGTADLAICRPGVLEIIDWKYGLGVQVFAERNTQLLLYAWGFFTQYDLHYGFKVIRLHIAQPRRHHFDVWETTREELFEFAEHVKHRAYESYKPNAPRSPSPKACQWCKVRVTCTALETAREYLADTTFDYLDEPITVEEMARVKGDIVTVEHVEAEVMDGGRPPHWFPPAVELSTDDLSRIYKWRGLMGNWFREIGEELTKRALDGEDIGDWKIVEGRANRKWRDESQVVETVAKIIPEEDLYTKKLVSPAQCEKLLKGVGVKGRLLKQYVGMLVTRGNGKPTLAPTGDNRAALPNFADDTFDAEEE